MTLNTNEWVSNPTSVTDMMLPTNEEFKIPEDTSIFTSSPLTPTASSSSSEFDLLDSTQLHSAPKTPSAARQSPPYEPSHEVDDQVKKMFRNIFIVAAYSFAIMVGIAWYTVHIHHEPPKTSLLWPTVNSTDVIITSYNNWEDIHGFGNGYEYVPQAIKHYETTITHMRAAIKHSAMRNRKSLEEEMQAFSAETDQVISKLVTWDSLAQATVEEIQNTSDFAVKSTPGWTSDTNDHKRKNKELRKLLSKESRKIGGHLDCVQRKSPSLLQGLDIVGMHLRTIADLLQGEEASLDSKDKEFANRAYPLRKMAEVVMEGQKMISNLEVTVKKSTNGLERLHQAVRGIEDKAGCDTKKMSLCLDNIQDAVDRLGDAWKPYKSRTQTPETQRVVTGTRGFRAWNHLDSVTCNLAHLRRP